MDILPIDFDMTIVEISKWFDQWKSERFGGESLQPERYYNITEDGRFLYGVKEGESLNDEKAICDRVLDLLLKIRLINQKLSGRGLSQHLQYVEREQLKKEREGLYNEFLELTQQPQNLNPKIKKELKEYLPEKLKSDEAVDIFQKAIDSQLIECTAEYLDWKDTKQLLAYFAEKMSNKFGLINKVDKNGNKTTAWKPFEKLFNETDLKGAKQNWMRLNTKFEPTGFEKVDSLLI